MKKTMTALLQGRRVLTENSNAARALARKGTGTLLTDKRVALAPMEALMLVEEGRVRVVDGQGKHMPFDRLARLLGGSRDFWTSYVVFRDLSERGYRVKTGLKFGADFRVYDSPDGHARWIVHPVAARKTLTWHEFAAKNRVAHSTNKRLLVAVVDDEDAVNYWEVAWLKP